MVEPLFSEVSECHALARTYTPEREPALFRQQNAERTPES